MAFNIGLSGIRAASTDLEVTGNNIANASTTGFKQSRAEFGDVYTSTLLGTGALSVGSGVSVENIRQQFSQGNISGTGNSLDLAIDGNGFFILKDGSQNSYSRSGIFSLDKDGFVVGNTGARLQGFAASSEGLVNGILGDMRIEAGNQPPALTSRVTARLNLNASEEVLQEQGKKITSNGLAIGSADSGIIKSTASTLVAAGQPTTAGAPSQGQWATLPVALTVAAMGTAGYAPADNLQMTIDIGDGAGPQTLTLQGVAVGGTELNVLSDIQSQLDATFGSQKLTAGVSASGELSVSRAGYGASNASSFTLTTNTAFDTAFGTAPVVTAGVSGTKLFVGSSPAVADFRTIPGTSSTTRTTATPPLNIVSSSAGQLALLQADNLYSGLDFSGANKLDFTMVTESGATYNIALDSATLANDASVDINEMVTAINTQINAQAGGVANAEAQAVAQGGKIEFQMKSPANAGDYVQIADVTATSSNYNLNNLGFLSANHYNTGVEPVLANNEFMIAVTSTTGQAANAFQVIIPPNNYASLKDVAAAIQQQIDTSIGAGGVSDKVKVAAVGGQLVFTNTNTGGGEGISLTPTTGAPAAHGALGFTNLFTVNGSDEEDRSNNFRINLTIPAPDQDQRSGSVVIELNENYRSVQQLATSINRQLNSQEEGAYIGVRAQAAEVIPKVSPPEFKLELLAVKEGEASVVSISDITASGSDVSAEQMFALLQTNPDNNGLLTTGIEGVNNQYPEQRVTLTNPEGQTTVVTIPEGAEANEAASLFNKQAGVSANATTTMTVPLSGYQNTTGNMKLSLNGQELSKTTLAEIAEEINSLRSTTLPAFKAEIDDAGNLVVTNDIGRDIKLDIRNATTSDSMVVQGIENTSPVSLGGATSAAKAAAVGGSINFTLNEGYNLNQPEPVVSGMFNTLSEGEFTQVTLNAFDPTDQKTYNHTTSNTMYDSLGNSHVMTQYFVKEPLDPSRPNEQNVWAMYVQVDGQDVGDPDATQPFPQNLESTRSRFELFFNQDGTLDTNATGDLYVTNWDPSDANGDPTGALKSQNVLEGGLPIGTPPTSSNFQVDLAGSTLFGSAFSVDEVSQNGYTTGRLSGLNVDSDGKVFARYTNGHAQVLGQVAMANFRNSEGLNTGG